MMASVIMSCSWLARGAHGKKPESGGRTWYEACELAGLLLVVVPSAFFGGILAVVLGG